MTLPSKGMARISSLLLLTLFVAGCGRGYFRQIDEERRYVVAGITHKETLRAAYELCRRIYDMGYEVIRQPRLEKRNMFIGKIQCVGPYDTNLAIRYDYLPTWFSYGDDLLSSRYYYSWKRKPESVLQYRERKRRVRTNTLLDDDI